MALDFWKLHSIELLESASEADNQFAQYQLGKIAILFSQVKVQVGDQSETFLIDGIPKEYDDLSASRQLEWFLQDIDSDATVQVHADAYLYGEGEVVNANYAELCYFLDRMRLNPNFLESRCQSAGSSDFSFNWSQEELFGLKFSS